MTIKAHETIPIQGQQPVLEEKEIIKVSAKWPIIIGATTLTLLLTTLGWWSVWAHLAGALVAQGVVEVENERQVVQHAEGGVVRDIFAYDGQSVQAGEVLVRLDDTFLRPELILLEQQLFELAVRKVRLVAEQHGADTLEFKGLKQFSTLDQTWARKSMEAQKALFKTRYNSLGQRRSQFFEQKKLFAQQIEGLTAQRDATQHRLMILEKEEEELSGLRRKELIPATRLYTLQKDIAAAIGVIGSLNATIAEVEIRITSNDIEVLRLVEQRREEAITSLGELVIQEIDLQERRLRLLERLSRLDLRSPVNGVVFDSKVFTQQSVVVAAEALMYVVPQDQGLQISARVEAIDIEEVYEGQEVTLRFTTFEQHLMPHIDGSVVQISADAREDNYGRRYYEVLVIPNADAFTANPDLTLLPGMPVEVFIKTSERTLLDYLIQPLVRYFYRALRES